jgi:hypothetical protein
LIVHVPACWNETVEPVTVQIPVVAELKVTGLPEPPPVAVTVYVAPLTTAFDGAVEVNVIVWAACATATVALGADVAVHVR